jgi:hypothetical protein
MAWPLQNRRLKAVYKKVNQQEKGESDETQNNDSNGDNAHGDTGTGFKWYGDRGDQFAGAPFLGLWRAHYRMSTGTQFDAFLLDAQGAF